MPFYARSAVEEELPVVDQTTYQNAAATKSAERLLPVETSASEKEQDLVSAAAGISLGHTQRPIYPNVPFSPYSSPRYICAFYD
ncbi:hypothetical protein J6590_050070 [Homalodisca vitripennis]|nr:hypothetical protein J6590_050070 [Homalodisca vitripennis]